ncbi:hypothetical protein HFC70_08925 [Agrobacterium sp. a22-2]|nr:hypothetical protein [Agrobacterium sp. a22-2]
MSIRAILTACALILAPAAALADPTGTFKVTGSNEDATEEYTGTVKVVRTGQTYAVYWEIAGDEFVGTGLGAKFIGDRFEMGPASDDDTAISVGYVSKENFGIAMYFEQPDGSWQGVWTYGGSEKVISENWTR